MQFVSAPATSDHVTAAQTDIATVVPRTPLRAPRSPSTEVCADVYGASRPAAIGRPPPPPTPPPRRTFVSLAALLVRTFGGPRHAARRADFVIA
jgi:hypothetical protein